MKVNRKQFLASAGLLFSMASGSPWTMAAAQAQTAPPVDAIVSDAVVNDASIGDVVETAQVENWVAACGRELAFCKSNHPDLNPEQCIQLLNHQEASPGCWRAFTGAPQAEGGPHFEGGPHHEGGPHFEGGPHHEGGPNYEGGPHHEGGPHFEGGPHHEGAGGGPNSEGLNRIPFD